MSTYHLLMANVRRCCNREFKENITKQEAWLPLRNRASAMHFFVARLAIVYRSIAVITKTDVRRVRNLRSVNQLIYYTDPYIAISGCRSLPQLPGTVSSSSACMVKPQICCWNFDAVCQSRRYYHFRFWQTFPTVGLYWNTTFTTLSSSSP